MEHDGGISEHPADGADVEGLVDEAFDAWMAVWKAQILVVRALERDLKESVGLPLTACEVLSKLGAAPGGRLRMQELARQVLLSKSGISQLVTQLSRLGLVERQGDPDNLRVTYAVLTEKGRAAFPAHAPVFLQGVRRYFSQHLTDDEVETITRAMTKVIKALGYEQEAPHDSEAARNLVSMTRGGARSG
ncbi:MarR family winged helix-turn-helix transcriptional regulator [Carbonactinospora thermoautotrophica]|uniref:MarR family winged helix-turn-helix transcriptional regulator n=1 Tax=Carbonactinospora thermoautotrophica TaxID=1469144 RepID=UPI000ACBEF88|nr:MarR family transcriptional regulator [Carbonactinospora thermoautotrophica]